MSGGLGVYRCGFTLRKVPLVWVQRSSYRWYVTHLFEGRDFSQQCRRYVNLKEDSGEEVRVSVVDGWSKDGILQFGWSDIR